MKERVFKNIQFWIDETGESKTPVIVASRNRLDEMNTGEESWTINCLNREETEKLYEWLQEILHKRES